MNKALFDVFFSIIGLFYHGGHRDSTEDTEF